MSFLLMKCRLYAKYGQIILIMEFENMANEAINVSLIKDNKAIIEESKKLVTRNVNTIMLQTYWNIGGRIIEEEQNGNDKVSYREY